MSASLQGGAFRLEAERLKKPKGILSLKVADLLYGVSLFAWIFFYVLNTSFYAIYLVDILKVVRFVCLILLFFSELLSARITIKHIAGIALCAIVAVVGLRVSQSTFVDTVAFILCARNRNFRDVAKICLVSIVAAMVVVILSAYAGIIQNYVQSGTRNRIYLGFRYALYPSAFLFSITCLIIYLSGDRISLQMAFVLVALNWICHEFTDSNLSFGMALIVVMLAVVHRYAKGRLFSKNWIGVAVCSCFIAAALLSLLPAMFYDSSNEFSQLLDQTLEGRMLLSHRAIENYGVTLFGQNLKADMVGAGLNMYGQRIAGTYFYVDCLYVRMPVESGAIVFVIYLAAMTALCVRAWRTGDCTTGIILLCIALFGIVDNLLMNLYYNPFLLMIGSLLVDAPSFGKNTGLRNRV